MDYRLVKVQKFQDKRGYLSEFLTRREVGANARFGHIYFVTFVSLGVVRGNHYHTRKKEFFGVALGKVEITIEDIKTKERKVFTFNADDPEFIRLEIGPNIAHAVKSLSANAVLIDYFTSPYNAKHPDSFKYIIYGPNK